MAVGDIHRRGINLALVEFDRAFVLTDQGSLLVQYLFGDGILAPENFVAVQIDACFSQEGLVARQLSLRLQQCRLKRAHVDLGERVAFMDDLTFVIEHLHQLPIHAGMDSDGIEWGDCTEPGPVDADIAFLRCCRDDGDSWWAGRAARRCLHVGTSARAHDEAKDHHEHCGAQDPEDSARSGPHETFLRLIAYQLSPPGVGGAAGAVFLQEASMSITAATRVAAKSGGSSQRRRGPTLDLA